LNGCPEHLVLLTGVTPLFILKNLSKLALVQVLSFYHFVINNSWKAKHGTILCKVVTQSDGTSRLEMKMNDSADSALLSPDIGMFL